MDSTTDATGTTEATVEAAATVVGTDTHEPRPVVPPETLRLAFEANFAAILGAPAVGSPTLDAGYGAERALELAAVAKRQDVATRLGLLPDVIFGAGQVALVESLAHATLYADELVQKQSQPSEDKVPDAILEEAEAVRATLYKLIDYHFGDDPAVTAELAEFRGRRGSFRVAATLARLAALARDRADTLSKDAKYWRDDLLADAERLARSVQSQIGAISEKDALELKRRAYGLLEAAFNDVRIAISFVMRHELALVEPLPVMKKPATRKPRGEAAPAATA
jgi:hypothetical protein